MLRSICRRVAPRFMIMSQRPGRRVAPGSRRPAVLGLEPFAIGSLLIAPRRVETIPCPADGRPSSGRAFACSGRAPSRRDESSATQCFAVVTRMRRRHVSGQGRRSSHPRARPIPSGPARAAPRALTRRRTTSCPRVVGRARAWQHMDHSPTIDPGSIAPLRKTYASKARALNASGNTLERRGGCTFTLGTCPTDFPRFASLPRSVCTVTSVRASLGSCQGELTLSWRTGAPTRAQYSWRTGARARSASLQVQSRVFVPKLGRAPYIGAGDARQTLDSRGLDEAAPDSQYPRRRQRPFTATVRDRHECREPMSPPREQLGARWI
jgi:hypothetical protein